MHLGLAALPLFSPASLRRHKRMRGQAPGCGCPEAQYGFELYGAVHRVLGRKVTLHAEFSYTKRGRIDFFLLAERWGIEVLKDGDRLAEQISRCKPSGRYGSWGVVKDYTILDFRTKMPSKSYGMFSCSSDRHSSR